MVLQKTQTLWSFTFFIKPVRVLDCLLDGWLIAISSLHLGSSFITSGLYSTSTALTVELHQFTHWREREKKSYI